MCVMIRSFPYGGSMVQGKMQTGIHIGKWICPNCPISDAGSYMIVGPDTDNGSLCSAVQGLRQPRLQ